jgi:large subunit ribosomal protein L31
MKKGIHPENYRPVVFQDNSSGWRFLTRSTIRTTEKVVWEDGKEYDTVKLEITSDSHPFYTGKNKFVDTEGRVERFQNKFAGNYAEQKKIKKPKLEKFPKIKKLNEDPLPKKGAGSHAPAAAKKEEVATETPKENAT